ncbi:hypothetical protein GCM10027020_18700 [Nocardioides salsibiostraticola]
MARNPVRVDRRLLLDLVADIAHTLSDEALWDASGSRCLWLGDEVVEFDGAFPVVHHDVGGSLYSGSAGIGWFLAFAGSALADPEISATARAGLRHGLDWTRDNPSPSLHAGSTGVGLACLRSSQVLADDALESQAIDVILQASEHAAASSPGHGSESDLISGDAGIVVGLLGAIRHLEQSGRAPSAVLTTLHERVRQLGERLIDAADRTPTGWIWPSGDGSTEPPLCGLGHGASGPALALAELASCTGDEAFAEASRQACRSERAWFGGTPEGWPDLREYTRLDLTEGRRPTAPHLWCHGSLGVGVTRLQIWAATGDPAALAEATAALHFAQSSLSALGRATPGEYAANFSLCHGAAGLIDFFLLASEVLEDRSWLPAAAAAVGVGVRHLEATGSWRCGVEGSPQQPTATPGLMLGLAGTGAALLRLSYGRTGEGANGSAGTPRMNSPLLMVEQRSRRVTVAEPLLV